VKALALLACCLVGPAIAGKARDADAEVQVNLCSPVADVVRALALSPAGKPREAWYFDTASLDLFARGALFRLRTGAGAPELTLKAAGQDCAKVPPALLPKGAAKCEYDIHGTSVAGAVSLTRTLEPAQARGLLDGTVALADLLSAAQVRYLRDGLAVWPLAAGMRRLGPARIEGWRAPGGKYVVEEWQLPSGKRYVELSQKAPLGEAQRLQAQLMVLIAARGVQACPDQGSMAGEKLRDYLR
jgi:hypothetical protein